MKVKTLIQFKDKKENVVRKKNDEFIVNKNRFAEINNTAKKLGYTDFVEEIKEK